MKPNLELIVWWEPTIRLSNVLGREGCKTIHDVLRLGRGYFRATPNVGQVSLKELDEHVARAGRGIEWWTAFNSLKGAKPTVSRTVRVRILVAVDKVDSWTAVGSSHIDENDARRHLNCSRSARYSWVEADVPLPEPELTVVGQVTEDVT